MGVLTIWQNGRCTRVPFRGTPLLSAVLTEGGVAFAHPCGGRGTCGNCAARVEGQVSPPSGAEQKAGTRLTCQTVLLGDASVWLADGSDARIETSGAEVRANAPMGSGYGCAIDIGTTTLVLKLFDLTDGRPLATESCLNPQRAAAADVMGRIDAAMHGQGPLLQGMLTDALRRMLADACAAAAIPTDAVETAVVTGNTTMLYLLTGRDPACLSRAPFRADTLFGQQDRLLGMDVYYPHCMNAFVGADITCAVLASGMCNAPDTALLCDIGTNGEIALWKDGKLHVTSTAAGPAFEGAGISRGCGSIPGAIDHVRVEHGAVLAHTIDDKPAVGICGSGLIDAVAAFLETGAIDETGATEEDELPLRDGISLLPKDIRAVQLAKGSVAAGIRTLLETAGLKEDDIQTLYIAGGFGSHLNIASAAAIGLIPESMQKRVKVLGNAALTGAAQLLLDQEMLAAAQKLAEEAEHLNLGGNPVFNRHFAEQMLFGAEDLWD